MAIEAFLKLDGVAGESVHERHRDEIEALGFEFAAGEIGAQSGGRGGASNGKTSFHDLIILKRIDRATPILALHCANGRRIREGRLSVRRAGPDTRPYLTYSLKDCQITKVAHVAGVEDATPRETIALRYAVLEIEYAAQEPDGSIAPSVRMGWDIPRNRAV